MIDPHAVIFPTESPVKQLDGEVQTPPAPLEAREYKERSAKLLCKLHPLIQARMEADKVYSNGYFERNYKDADKKLKRLLHERVRDAWAHSLSPDDEEVERPKGGLGSSGITIQINLGG